MRRAIVLAVFPLLNSVAGAQDTTSGPAIVIRAEVNAREIRFGTQPSLRVVLANGSIDSIRVLERRNLPQPIQTGVTYRDVYIAVEILGRLNAECIAARITRQDVSACGTPRDTSRRSP
jgi:hypothetical protein